jgi:hypothetical protein
MLGVTVCCAFIAGAHVIAASHVARAETRWHETRALVMTPPAPQRGELVAQVRTKGAGDTIVVVDEPTTWGDTVTVWVDRDERRVYPFAAGSEHPSPIPSETATVMSVLAATVLLSFLVVTVALLGSVVADGFRHSGTRRPQRNRLVRH